VDAGERETYIRYVDQILARVIQKIEDSSPAQQFVIIIDMEGLTLRQFTSPSSKSMTIQLQKKWFPVL